MNPLSRNEPWGVVGDSQMVATGHPLAAQAAARMLREGGSAIDAAIAADAVRGVAEPMATGIGGDVLAMVVPPGEAPLSYNGTGRAPAQFSLDALDRLPGRRIPERHVFSVAVPGVVRGWHDLHSRFGRLPWQRLFQSAIQTARGCFPVAPVAAREWALFEPVLRLDPVSAALYRAGAPPRAGETFANPELATVLEAIANEGPDAFYLGAPAVAAERAAQQRGGALARGDFASPSGPFAPPASARFRGLTVLECPPNTHGIAVLHALQALDALSLDPTDPATTVAMVEHMGRRSEEHTSELQS